MNRSTSQPNGWLVATSIGADLAPIVGNVKSAVEVVSGKDAITGEKLSATDRWVAAAGIIIPQLKTLRKADKILDLFTGAGNAGRYSGALVKVNKPDAAADALAERIGGQSRMKFSNDPPGREFDTISDQYVAQSKPALQTVNKDVRNQMKATFEAAQETGKKVYYHFEGQPAQSVIDKLNEYSSRYGIEVVIDTKPLK